MPRPRSVVPTYRKHKQSGLALVTVRNSDGTRKDVSLGVYGSPESKAEYRRICAVLDANSGISPGCSAGTSVIEVILPFIKHVDVHHRRADGTKTHETVEYRNALRPLKELFGHTPANEFGPLKLQVVRDAMIKAGLSRMLINRRIGRIKRLFKWSASQELVPPSIFHGLQSVSGLQRGRSAAKELAPVRPVEESVVLETLPFLTRHVAGLVRFQLLTGCRPGEACTLRRCDIDTSGAVWLYRPPYHKLAYRNDARVIAIGPRAQAVLSEFPTVDNEQFVFSPDRNVKEVNAERSKYRKTPRFPSHMARNELRRKAAPIKKPDAKYSTLSYGRSIVKAITLANRVRSPEKQIPRWHPNQLRHTKGTELRKIYGIEAAQVVLGHSKANTTEIYAERNLGLAVKVAGEVG